MIVTALTPESPDFFWRSYYLDSWLRPYSLDHPHWGWTVQWNDHSNGSVHLKRAAGREHIRLSFTGPSALMEICRQREGHATETVLYSPHHRHALRSRQDLHTKVKEWMAEPEGTYVLAEEDVDTTVPEYKKDVTIASLRSIIAGYDQKLSDLQNQEREGLRAQAKLREASAKVSSLYRNYEETVPRIAKTKLWDLYSYLHSQKEANDQLGARP